MIRPVFTARCRSSIALLSVAAFLAACGPGAATAPAAPSGQASVAPVATPPASTVPAPSPTAASTPKAVAIADGTYLSETFQVADWRAAINADDKLTEAEKTRITDTLFELDGHTTIQIQIKLAAGSWIQYGAFDGGVFDVGSTATYAFPDDSTIVISEECCGLTTFAVTRGGDGFTLKRASAAPNELEAITAKLIFESSPFHEKP